MRRIAALSLACGILVGLCGGVAAQSWPTKPIRAILPIAPGTGSDVVFRLVFNQVSIQLGQQIVIENRGGAGGTLGAATVAKAEPDGYTIMGSSTSHTIAPALYTHLPYDVRHDFAAVVPLGMMPTALVMAPSKGIRTVQQFVAEAKTKPGGFTFASAGVGSSTHLTAERFRLSAGFDAIHVPFRGGGFRPEIASGRVDFGFSPIAVAVPDIRDGRLVALAVSGRVRASALPDVQTTLEAGFPNSDYALWLGVFMPARTPRAIVDRMHDEVVKALNVPALRDKLAAVDLQSMIMSPAEFDAFIENDIVNQGTLAKAAGLKAN
jgi:tripartite-type tricarboxylate transporter receptor subunit TctC